MFIMPSGRSRNANIGKNNGREANVPVMNRRTFFTSSALGALTLGTSPICALGDAESRKILNFNPAMKYRRMGNTGFDVSVVSLGGLVAAESVQRYAIERGVNLVHVAWHYLGGQSIKTLGSTMKTQRDKVYIALKDDYPTIDDALKALNTDYVDFLMFNRHSVSDATDPRIAETFEKLKNQGKVRFAGLTIHGDVQATTGAGIRSGFYNVVMPVLNQPSLEAMTEELRLAQQRGVGIMAMKSMKGLKGIEMEVSYLKKALSNPAVTTITKGIGSFDMFDAYLQAVDQPLTSVEDRSLYRYAQANRNNNCMMCDECKRACPLGIEVSTVLRCKDYYYEQMRDEQVALSAYKDVPPGKTGGANCRQCRKCEASCPNGIAIAERLGAAQELFARMA